MLSMDRFKAQQGFLTIAQNTPEVDYVDLAYKQAINIKNTQTKINQVAVIVDQYTSELMTSDHCDLFDHIIVLNEDWAENDQWKLKNELQVFDLSPFKETIKLESDLLLTQSIDHWWDSLRLRDICFSLNCLDHRERTITESPYRKLHKENSLPDIYNGMFYFRYSQTATDFARIARQVWSNWDSVKQELIACDQQASTDLVYSVAVKILGEEFCTMPSLDFFKFVHMKSGINGWNDRQPWTDFVNVEWDQARLRINNRNQYSPVHYHEKEFLYD